MRTSVSPCLLVLERGDDEDGGQGRIVALHDDDNDGRSDGASVIVVQPGVNHGLAVKTESSFGLFGARFSLSSFSFRSPLSHLSPSSLSLLLPPLSPTSPLLTRIYLRCFVSRSPLLSPRSYLSFVFTSASSLRVSSLLSSLYSLLSLSSPHFPPILIYPLSPRSPLSSLLSPLPSTLLTSLLSPLSSILAPLCPLLYPLAPHLYPLPSPPSYLLRPVPPPHHHHAPLYHLLYPRALLTSDLYPPPYLLPPRPPLLHHHRYWAPTCTPPPTPRCGGAG